jgi:hypothetical protein
VSGRHPSPRDDCSASCSATTNQPPVPLAAAPVRTGMYYPLGLIRVRSPRGASAGRAGPRPSSQAPLDACVAGTLSTRRGPSPVPPVTLQGDSPAPPQAGLPQGTAAATLAAPPQDTPVAFGRRRSCPPPRPCLCGQVRTWPSGWLVFGPPDACIAPPRIRCSGRVHVRCPRDGVRGGDVFDISHSTCVHCARHCILQCAASPPVARPGCRAAMHGVAGN